MADDVRWSDFEVVGEDVNWSDFEPVDSSYDDAEAKRNATRSAMREDEAASKPAFVSPSSGKDKKRQERPEGAGVMWDGLTDEERAAKRLQEVGFAQASQERRTLQDDAAAEAAGRPTGAAEPISGPDATVGNVAKDLLVNAPVGGLRQARGALRYGAGVASGSESLREAGLAELRDVALTDASQTPQFGNEAVNAIYQGARSFAQQTPGAAAAIATGNIPLGLAYLAMPTAGQAFEKYNSRGGTDKEAMLGGLSEAALEVVTEKLPMGFVVGNLGRMGVGRFLAGFLGRELATEQIATLTQDAVDTAVANPDKSWNEYLNERFPAAMQTTLGVIGAGGAAGALQTGANIVAGRREQAMPTARQMIDSAFRTPNITDLTAVEQQKRSAETAAIMGAETADDAIAAAAEAVSRPHEAAAAVDQVVWQAQAQKQAAAQAEEMADAIDAVRKEAGKTQPSVPGRPPLPTTPVIDQSAFVQPEAVSTEPEQVAEPEQVPEPTRNWRWIRVSDRTDEELSRGLQEARTENARRGIQAEIDRRSRGFAAQPQGLVQPTAEPSSVTVSTTPQLAEQPTAQVKAKEEGPTRNARLAAILERRAMAAKEAGEVDRAADFMAEAEMLRLRDTEGMRRAAEPVSAKEEVDFENEAERELGIGKNEFVVAKDDDLGSDLRSWSKQHGTEAFYDAASDKVYVLADNIQPTVYSDRNGKPQIVLSRKERFRWVLHHEGYHRAFRIYEEGKWGKPLAALRDARGFTNTLTKVASNKNVSTIAQRLRDGRARTGNTLSKGLSIEEALVEIGSAVNTGRWDELKGRYGVDISPSSQYGMRKAWNAFADFWRKVLRAITKRDVPFSDSEVLAVLKDVRKAGQAAKGKPPVKSKERAQSTAVRNRDTRTANEMSLEADRLQSVLDEADGDRIRPSSWRSSWVEDLADWGDQRSAQRAIDELRDRAEVMRSLHGIEVDEAEEIEPPKPQVADVMEAAARGEFTPDYDPDLPPNIPEGAYTDRPTQAQRENKPPARSPDDYNVGTDRAEAVHAEEMNSALMRAAGATVPAAEPQPQAKEKRRPTPKNFRDTAFNNAEGDLFTALPKRARERLMKAWKEMRGKGGFFALERNPWQREQAVTVERAVSTDVAKKAISALGLDKQYDVRVYGTVEKRNYGQEGYMTFTFYKKGDGRTDKSGRPVSRSIGSATMTYHSPEDGYRYYLGPSGHPDKKAWFYVLHTMGFNNDGVGKKFYTLAAQIASMNGILISPDGILTNVNQYRRTENMISAALRLGDKMTIVPHKVQAIYGWNHRPANEEQYDRNMVRMLIASARNVQRLANRYPELEKIDQLRYDPAEDRFTMKDGSDGEELVKLIYEKSTANSYSTERWAGRTTVARMALTQAILAKEAPEKNVISFKKPVVQSTMPTISRRWAEGVKERARNTDPQVSIVESPSNEMKAGGIFREVAIDFRQAAHIYNRHPDVTPDDIASLPGIKKPRAIFATKDQKGNEGFAIVTRSRTRSGHPIFAIVRNTNEFGPKKVKVSSVHTMYDERAAASVIARALLNGDMKYMPGAEIDRLLGLLRQDAVQLRGEPTISEDLRPSPQVRTQEQKLHRPTPFSGQTQQIRILSDEAVVKMARGDKDWNDAKTVVELPVDAPERLAGLVFSTAPPVDSAAFRNWFGDSAVVDDDGKPMLVYHSTSAAHKEWGGVPTEAYEFQSFDTARSEMGTHFGTKEHANAFGGNTFRRVIPAYLSIKNPLRLKDYGGFSPGETSGQLVDLGIITGEEADRIVSDVGFQYLNDQKFLQDKIKEAGYDGIVYLNRREGITSEAATFGSLQDSNVLSDDDFKLQFPEAKDSWIAFDRGQIKSPFNVGTFDAAKDDFLQSTNPNPLNSWRIPDETKGQAVLRYLQDYMTRAKVIQAAIKKQGGVVNESNDVVGALERSHGRVQVSIERLKEQFLKPLAEKLADNGLSFDELAVFAYAKHAPERNSHIAGIRNNMPDGGSGMSNDDAQAIIDTARQAGFLSQLEDAHKDLMALGEATRRILLEEGLISQQTYDAWEQMYQNYVPLRGFEHVDEEGSAVRTGRGIDVRGKESLRALGRRSRAANLVENMILDYERAIVRAEKNLVSRTFASLVQANPDPMLWEIDPNRVSTTFDKNRQLVIERRVPDKGEDTIAYKEDGDIVYVKVKDPLLLRALKRTYFDETGDFQHILAKNIGWYNNWIRNTLTQYNPAFLVVNGIRDSQTGAFSALDTLGPGAIPKYTKHYASAMRSAWNMARKNAQTQDWAPWVDEFENSGAITGGFYMRDAERVMDELRGMLLDAGGTLNQQQTGIRGAAEKAYLKARGSLAGKLAAKTVQFVEHAGQASENMSRLALYRTAREMGKTPAEAASIAKNGTVNFNTRGELGTGMNALYLFFNASVQGSMRTMQALKNPYVQTAMAGMTALSATFAALNAMWGGDDDDDGVAYWDKIADYEKERNLILFNPFSEKKGDYIKFPAPYGFSVFNVLGYALADTARWMADPKRGKPPVKSAINITSAIMGSYNPLGGSFDPKDPVAMTMLLSPTVLDHGVQIMYEVSSFGSKNAPPADVFRYPRPDSERVFLSDTGTVQHRLARWLNTKTGGNQAQSGAIDILPATFETLTRAATGGLGTFGMDVMNTMAQMIDPVEDVQTRNVPWLKSLYGKPDERTTARNFYENRQEIERDYKQLLSAMKLGIKVDMEDPENKALLRIGKHMDRVNEFMGKLRKAEVAIIENEKMGEEDKKTRRKEIALQREKLMKGFNKAFNEVWGPVR